MRPKFAAAAMFLAFAVTTSGVFALSDAEYKVLLKTSPAYRQAEADLAFVWQQAMQSLKRHEGMAWRELRDDQRDWLASGRDACAQAYLQQGQDKAQAYTQATRDRIAYLKRFVD
ncbi:MAG: hypothetical protein K6G15_12230 [Desulfovibrio sp.]|nr:hypothetical protein [Desulfovibrio sp.]